MSFKYLQIVKRTARNGKFWSKRPLAQMLEPQMKKKSEPIEQILNQHDPVKNTSKQT